MRVQEGDGWQQNTHEGETDVGYHKHKQSIVAMHQIEQKWSR